MTDIQTIQEQISNELKETAETILAGSEKIATSIEKISSVCTDILSSGGKILIAGNGGSAADAQHFAAELTGRYKHNRKAIPCLALTSETAFLTAWSNDIGFEDIFSRQLEAFGKEGDVFIGMTTSGNSPNIIRAMEKAKQLNITTVLFTGKSGGKSHGTVTLELNAQSDDTPRIQEVHIVALHILAGLIEKSAAIQQDIKTG